MSARIRQLLTFVALLVVATSLHAQETEGSSDGADRDAIIRQAMETIRDRVEELELHQQVIGGEPGRIVVQLPGLDGSVPSLGQIGSIRLVDRDPGYWAQVAATYALSGQPPDDDETPPLSSNSPVAPIGLSYFGTLSEAQTFVSDLTALPVGDVLAVPNGYQLFLEAVVEDMEYSVILVSTAGGVSSDTVVNAVPTFDDRNRPRLSLELNDEGAVALCFLTTQRVGEPLAIILGERLASVPVVLEPICDGELMIHLSGRNEGDIADLAIALNRGSLPSP